MNILEQIWLGNLSPYEKFITKGSEQDKLFQLIIRDEESLRATLTEQQIEILEKLKSNQSEFNCMLEYDAFVVGFKLGVQIMVETLTQ